MSQVEPRAWGQGGERGQVREARARDAFALGELVQQALGDALSAEVDVDELDPDALALGVNLLGGRGVDVLVAEVDDQVAGMVRVVQREFVRAQHIAEVQILVHPAARRRGVGRALLAQVDAAFIAGGIYRKLAVRVAADDAATWAAFQAAGWTLERTERGALGRSGRATPGALRRPHFVDVRVLARYAPPPAGVGRVG